MASPVRGTKGDMAPPSQDQLIMMLDSLNDLFAGGVPSPGMQGGTTVVPKSSPFVESADVSSMPTGNATTGFDTIAQMINQAPGVQMNSPVTPQSPVQDIRLQQPAGPVPPSMATGALGPDLNLPPAQPFPVTALPMQMGTPPLPEPNPAMQNTTGPDLRSIGEIMRMLFGGQNATPPVPQRNPLFTGGV